MTRCRYTVVRDMPYEIIIDDDNDGAMSVTNDAEAVVAELTERGRLRDGKRLFYYDSDRNLDELCHSGGRFTGFAPGPRRAS